MQKLYKQIKNIPQSCKEHRQYKTYQTIMDKDTENKRKRDETLNPRHAIKSEEDQEKIEELINLCKTFSKNMDIVNREQTEIKNYISKRDELAETNIKKLEYGIKNVLDQQVSSLKSEMQQLQNAHYTAKPGASEFQTKKIQKKMKIQANQ